MAKRTRHAARAHPWLTDLIGGRPRLGTHAFQLRSATVELGDVAGTQFTSESNVGPVFALAVRFRYRLGQDVFTEFDITGFSTFGRVGGTKGSILDAQLALGTGFGRGVEAFTGLRVYGGGADTRDR